MPGLDRIEAAVQPGVHALCSHSCQHGCMVSPKPPTQPAKTPRRRATLLQAQARRMSKLLSIEFGLALRDARLRASLSQRDLAKRARVRRTYISRVELGEQNLTLATMMRLARAVGLGVSLAITDDDPTLPTTLLSVSPSGPSPAAPRQPAAARTPRPGPRALVLGPGLCPPRRQLDDLAVHRRRLR
jgi:transcriptional regulator with XRE-family HTH domain